MLKLQPRVQPTLILAVTKSMAVLLAVSTNFFLRVAFKDSGCGSGCTHFFKDPTQAQPMGGYFLGGGRVLILVIPLNNYLDIHLYIIYQKQIRNIVSWINKYKWDSLNKGIVKKFSLNEIFLYLLLRLPELNRISKVFKCMLSLKP